MTRFDIFRVVLSNIEKAADKPSRPLFKPLSRFLAQNGEGKIGQNKKLP